MQHRLAPKKKTHNGKYKYKKKNENASSLIGSCGTEERPFHLGFVLGRYVCRLVQCISGRYVHCDGNAVCGSHLCYTATSLQLELRGGTWGGDSANDVTGRI